MLGISIALNSLSDHGACTAIFVAVGCVVSFITASVRTLDRVSWLAWVGLVTLVSAGKYLLITTILFQCPLEP